MEPRKGATGASKRSIDRILMSRNGSRINILLDEFQADDSPLEIVIKKRMIV